MLLGLVSIFSFCLLSLNDLKNISTSQAYWRHVVLQALLFYKYINDTLIMEKLNAFKLPIKWAWMCND